MPVISHSRLNTPVDYNSNDVVLKKSSSRSTRLSSIDLAKGIGIFFVVLVHALYRLDTGTQLWSAYTQSVILAFVMPLFFMISGALQGKKLRSRSFGSFGSFRDLPYLKKLVTAILLPFYALSGLFAVLNIAFLGGDDGPSALQMLRGVLIEQSNPALVPSGVLWYLFVLFVLSMLSYVAFKLMKVTGLYVLLCAGMLLHILYPSLFSEIDYFALRRIAQYSLFYFLGLTLPAIVLNEKLGRRRWVVSLCLACAGLSGVAAIATFHTNAAIDSIHATFWHLGLYAAVPCFFLLSVASLLCETAENTLSVRFLTGCGASSILIYVFHMPTFLVLQKGISMLGRTVPAGWMQLSLLVVGGFLMPLFYGYLLAYVPRVYCILLGRKPMVSRPLKSFLSFS